jgi:predicted secreted protein
MPVSTSFKPFTDKRSKQILLVAHCVLNQNAKLDRCAHYPGAIQEAAQAILSSGVGILQMPCPEMLYLGLDRQTDPREDPSVEAEDTRIAGRMTEEPAGRLLQRLVDDLVFQIVEYRKHGFEILGCLGINGSPTCGVETSWASGREQARPGVFVQKLNEELAKQGISLPMRGIKAYEPQKAVQIVSDLIKKV